MRKVLAGLLFLTIAGLLVSGCAMVGAPVNGFIYTDLNAPFAATSNAASTKTGTAECSSILGLVATGDCSIAAAARNGQITKIHHVDHDAFSVLGIYAKFTTKVYGE
jgi:hypothetical protein